MAEEHVKQQQPEKSGPAASNLDQRIMQILAVLIVLASLYPLARGVIALCLMRTTAEAFDIQRELKYSLAFPLPMFACLVANLLAEWADIKRFRVGLVRGGLLGGVLFCMMFSEATFHADYCCDANSYLLTGGLISLCMIASWVKIDSVSLNQFKMLGQWLLVILAALASAPGLATSPPIHWRDLVSRTHSDMRTIATALESYYIDHDTYPPHTFDPKLKADWTGTSAPMPAIQVLAPGKVPLTTPVAYLTKLFEDPCRFLDEKRSFAYYAPEGKTWLLISAGPNCVFDLTSDTLIKIFDPKTLAPNGALLSAYSYDPTNGADSPGDVWRVKQ